MDAPRSATAEELLEHADWVGALARSLARDAASADDLAQATLGAALSRPPASDRPLRPWLRRVAANLARREWRGEARRRSREQHAAHPERAAGPDELLARLEEQQ
ncbi:MAG TPA: sigma factor, partial [Planctomycetota bacterium]|nr:sigma factor [Planctomycetota bacterium]